jgi:hypothetical protein
MLNEDVFCPLTDNLKTEPVLAAIVAGVGDRQNLQWLENSLDEVAKNTRLFSVESERNLWEPFKNGRWTWS